MKEFKWQRRERKHNTKVYGMKMDGKSIFNIQEIQSKKGKKKMTSFGYKDALTECDRIRDNESIANLLVAYTKTGYITKEEAENIWWATRRCPVPESLRNRLGL